MKLFLNRKTVRYMKNILEDDNTDERSYVVQNIQILNRQQSVTQFIPQSLEIKSINKLYIQLLM